MKRIGFSAALFFSIFLFSCALSKQLKQMNHDANAAYYDKDFKTALSAYDKIISLKTEKNKEVEGIVYQYAGLSAWELGQTEKAIDYLEKAKKTIFLDAKTFSTLAKAYLEIDNLSREINSLEEYIVRYPAGEELAEVRGQLFLAYVESTNWHKADNLWPLLDEKYLKDVKILCGYMKVNRALAKTELMKKTALQVLKIDRNNVDALEVLAQEYYRLAEESYQAEMREYENNRTNKQYRQLLDALEVINANFRISRDYFERLYKLDPNPRYAAFLGNIYTRFDNKRQADYYYGKAKE